MKVNILVIYFLTQIITSNFNEICLEPPKSSSKDLFNLQSEKDPVVIGTYLYYLFIINKQVTCYFNLICLEPTKSDSIDPSPNDKVDGKYSIYLLYNK